MMSILIFDVGKTNKKAILYDYSYKEIWQTSTVLPEITDEDGFPCDDIHAILAWMKNVLSNLISDGTYQITHLNLSAYGASFVHFDEAGNILTPLYNYTKPIPSDIRASFYEKYGDEKKLALETASPSLDFLNSGLQLYYIKYRYPSVFEQIKWSLHLPQFLSYYFTKWPVSELTSIGCHTALWNFSKNEYHSWVYEEGMTEKFPPLTHTGTHSETTISGKLINIGVGIHDSSAALYPFSLLTDEPYLLLSTGTWSIVFNPYSTQPLTAEELENDCLLFLQPNGNPVKAARLFLGYSYQQKLEEIGKYFKHDLKNLSKEPFDNPLLDTISTSTQRYFSFPLLNMEEMPASATDLSLFTTFESAYYQMIWELSTYQIKAIKIATEGKVFQRMYIDGGFSKNNIFIQSLKIQLPSTEIIVSEFSSGASLGAAMQVKGH
jgi:sugar (pentulose or hexulose) kinase